MVCPSRLGGNAWQEREFHLTALFAGEVRQAEDAGSIAHLTEIMNIHTMPDSLKMVLSIFCLVFLTAWIAGVGWQVGYFKRLGLNLTISRESTCQPQRSSNLPTKDLRDVH